LKCHQELFTLDFEVWSFTTHQDLVICEGS
jgi:hypothetical protein